MPRSDNNSNIVQVNSNDDNDDQVNAAIADLRNDNRSGAAELLRHAANVFALLRAGQSQAVELSIAQNNILEASVAVIRAQPDMAPLARLADSAIQAVSRAAQGEEALQLAEQAASEFVTSSTRSAEQAIAHAAAFISKAKTVLTHSRSSTVLTAFKQAHRAGHRFRAIVTESRPMTEGRALAEALVNEGINTTLIADAAIATVIAQADCVLVGADRVTPETVVNKIGTRLMALAAREYGINIYALCDTSKFIASLSASSPDSHSRDELWPDAPPQVEIINHYFEPTPLAHFTSIICEDGLITPAEVSQRAAQQALNPRLLAALSKTWR